MIHGASTHHVSIVPEAMSPVLSQLNNVEERESGYYDFMVEIYKKHNVFFVGQLREDRGFYLHTNIRVETPYDLAGQRFRSSPMLEAFLGALGTTTFTMPIGDIYTAMERGMVDGYFTSSTMAADRGWYEVNKYRIEHPFYRTDILILVNLDAWNNLPKNLQDLMMDTVIKMEPEALVYYEELSVKAKQKLIEVGHEFIEFSPADAKWFVDTAYRAGWEALLKKTPETGPKIKELITK